MAGDAQADLVVDFEAAGGREEAEGRRPERVCRREDDAAVVDARGIGRGRRRAAQREVPFEEVLFERLGVVVGRGVLGELGGFFYWWVEEMLDVLCENEVLKSFALVSGVECVGWWMGTCVGASYVELDVRMLEMNRFRIWYLRIRLTVGLFALKLIWPRDTILKLVSVWNVKMVLSRGQLSTKPFEDLSV